MRTRQLAAIALAVPVVATPLVLTSAATAGAPAAAPVFGATWTVNTARNLLTEYAPGADGAATPIASIHGAATGLVHPTGVTISTSGTLYVAESGDNAITEYAPGATGNVAPLRTIKGSATGLDAPSSIVLSGHDLWVTNPATNLVEAFTAGSNGNELPAKSIGGHKTMLDHPVGLAINPDAEFLDAISSPRDPLPSISVINAPTGANGYLTGYSAAVLGNVAPVLRVNSTTKHPMVAPSAILADGLGAVLVADSSSNSVSEIVLDPKLARIFDHIGTIDLTGTKTGLDAPSGLDRNAFNQLVVTNSGNGTVTEYGQHATGDTAPAHTISGVAAPAAAQVAGSKPGQPTGLTVKLHRSKSTTGSSATLSWKAPTSTGGGIAGYDVQTAQRCVCGFDNGSGFIPSTGLNSVGLDGTLHVTTASTTFTKLRLHVGRKYAFRIVAVNAFGSSAPTEAATVTLPARSGPPEGLQAHAAAHSLQVFWFVPNHDGAEPVRSYHLEWATCVPGAKGCTFHTRVTASNRFVDHTVLRHLKAHTTYHLRVIAKTKLGLGKPSKVVTARTT